MNNTDKYRKGLAKSRHGFWSKVKALFKGKNTDIAAYADSVHASLIEADVSVRLTAEIMKKLNDEIKYGSIRTTDDVDDVLIDILRNLYLSTGTELNAEPVRPADRPMIYLIVGVNGSGKTTSIAKLAYNQTSRGHKVLLAAADTFRAGAVEQLAVWAERLGITIISGAENEDPASVVYKTLEETKKNHYDYVFIDTAGRLQNKANLMAELAKIRKVITKFYAEAPDEVLLVLDATTGQNGLVQAEVFKETAGLTGLILAKMDGTAKGGIVLTIRQQFGLPVRYVGLGEGKEDLIGFSLDEYLTQLFKEDHER